MWSGLGAKWNEMVASFAEAATFEQRSDLQEEVKRMNGCMVAQHPNTAGATPKGNLHV